jgi:hypothetical protein
MAVLCEKVLQEQDGVLTIIRIIDQLTQTAVGPEAPEQMPPFIAQNLTMVVTIKADQARGRYGLRIRPEAPGGFQLPPVEQAITISPGPGGVNVVMPMALPISAEGVYWFDVILTAPPTDQPDRLLTRVPLEVQYAPQLPAIASSP